MLACGFQSTLLLLLLLLLLLFFLVLALSFWLLKRAVAVVVAAAVVHVRHKPLVYHVEQYKEVEASYYRASFSHKDSEVFSFGCQEPNTTIQEASFHAPLYLFTAT